MKKISLVCLFLLSIFVYQYSFAWCHSIELGYSYSHDKNYTKYRNSGVMLSGDIFPVFRTQRSLWTINGALGQWHTNSHVNQNLTTAALMLALRYYPCFGCISSPFPYYLLANAGPAYLSKRRLNLNTQAKHVSIQTSLGLGVEFNKIDVNFRLVHFSNANTALPNDGFNFLYTLSVGYLF